MNRMIIDVYRRLCCFVIVGAILATPAFSGAMTFEKTVFSDEAAIGEQKLSLHGVALMRWLKTLRVYVAALYLPEGAKPDQVLEDIPKRLEISYLVSFKSTDFGKGAEPVLERNSTPADMARLRSRIDRLNAAYLDVKPGDRYAITYLPGRGTRLTLNGRPIVDIDGADFAAAYFGVWLGREPIDSSLKIALLKKVRLQAKGGL